MGGPHTIESIPATVQQGPQEKLPMEAGGLNMGNDPSNTTALGLTHPVLSSLGDVLQGFPTLTGCGRADTELGGNKSL